MRLLIVYGYEPSGHASSAKALEAAAGEAGPFEVVRVDVSGEYHPVMGSALAHLYLHIIQKSPALWDYLYDNPTVVAASKELRRLYMFLGGRKLKDKLVELKPDIVVCTHATPLGFLASAKSEGRLAWPLVGVITDYGVHSYWSNPHADRYLVPCEETRRALVERGVPEERVRVTGIPIHPLFSRPADGAAARRGLGLDPDRPVFLLSGGTRGLGSLAAAAEELLRKVPAAQILATCGNNKELLGRMKALAAKDSRLLPYGELDFERIRELMAAADLLIGKGGGLTIAESLAMGLPMVIFEPIPGQEERNAEHLLRLGAAVRAESLKELAGVVAGALEPDSLKALKARARALGKPDSAAEALREIVGPADRTRFPVGLD